LGGELKIKNAAPIPAGQMQSLLTTDEQTLQSANKHGWKNDFTPPLANPCEFKNMDFHRTASFAPARHAPPSHKSLAPVKTGDGAL